MSSPNSPHVLFYDGHCPFCLGWVNWLLRRDPNDQFRFAALTSQWARQFFQSHPRPQADSLLLWDGQSLHTESEAVWRIAAALPRPWNSLRWLRYLPRPLRDAAYRFIARHRYRWFGRHDRCQLPTTADTAKILE